MLFTPSHAELGQHPKTRKLARLLGVSIPTALGHLHLLWHFALKYAPDGDLAKFEPEDVAEGCMWEGDASAFVEAVNRAGWLDEGRVHDWDEYGGAVAERLQRRNDRKSGDYRRWRNAVMVRDDWTCQECGVESRDLHAHHILPFATNPERRFAVSNGVALCADCHRALHAREGC